MSENDTAALAKRLEDARLDRDRKAALLVVKQSFQDPQLSGAPQWLQALRNKEKVSRTSLDARWLKEVRGSSGRSSGSAFTSEWLRTLQNSSAHTN